MKFIKYTCAAFLFVAALVFAGCAHYSFDPLALAGYSIKDLQAAKDKGFKKEYALPKEEAFDKVYAAIQKIKGLKGERTVFVYQKSFRKNFLVLMGLPQQVNTTTAGVFFDSVDNGKTLVTISSLSDGAKLKAKEIVFGALDK